MDFKKRAFSSRFREYFLDIITCFLVLILSRSRRKIFVNKHIVCGQHFVNKQIYERLFVKYFRWLAFSQSLKYGTHFYWPSLAQDYHSILLSLWYRFYVSHNLKQWIDTFQPRNKTIWAEQKRWKNEVFTHHVFSSFIK